MIFRFYQRYGENFNYAKFWLLFLVAWGVFILKTFIIVFAGV